MDKQPRTTRNLASTRFKLREDLRCSVHEFAGKACHVIEDPVCSKFFRLGGREWTFVSLLTGNHTVRDALDLANDALAPRRLSKTEIAKLCRWLVESKLAHAVGPEANDGRVDPSAESPAPEPAAPKKARRISPFSIRIPLFNPDRLLAVVTPWTGWLFSVQCLTIWIFVCTSAGYRVAAYSDRFVADSAGLLSPSQWPYMIAIWLLLKVVHETAHGVACKKYGGSVPQAGIILILFSPVAYVDLTSAWRIRSKWRRIITSAAGMYAELGLAAVAAI